MGVIILINVVAASLREGPQLTLPPGVHTVCGPFPCSSTGGLCGQQNTAEMTEDCSFHLECWLTILCLFHITDLGETAIMLWGYSNSQWRGPCDKEPTAPALTAREAQQQTRERAWKQTRSPVEPGSGCRSDPHLDSRLRGTLSQGHPAKWLLDY